MSYGDTGAPENTYVRLGNEAVQERLGQFKIPFTLRKYAGAAHTWDTAKRGFTDWLTTALPLLNDPARQTQAPPATFSYSTIDTTYQVYGWSVEIKRKALEFSALEVTSPQAFSVIGSGAATVLTPPLTYANAVYKATMSGGAHNGATTIYLRTDASGRAVIPVALGPENAAQQFTLEANAGNATPGPDAATVPFTTRGDSRFYTAKVEIEYHSL